MSELLRLFVRPDWMVDAACRGLDVNLFFPAQGGPTREIRAVCDGCPVRVECRDYAVASGEGDGFWGGLSGNERQPLIVAAPPVVHPIQHGPHSCKTHVARGELPCWVCLDARHRYDETRHELARDGRWVDA
jgi:hypothetical protein